MHQQMNSVLTSYSYKMGASDTVDYHTSQLFLDAHYTLDPTPSDFILYDVVLLCVDN